MFKFVKISPSILAVDYNNDDVLFSASFVLKTQHMFNITQQCLKDSGLIIDPEKI